MLPTNTSVGPVSLFVPDLEQSTRFYVDVLGFKELGSDGDSKMFGAEDGAELLELVERPTWTRQGRRSPGLFHFAVLFPSRTALGRALAHLAQAGWSLSGAGDHLVSEALYLNDPDGNGIELYADRPRSTWTFEGGLVQMDTLPIDIDSLLAEGAQDPSPYSGLPAGTTMGHVHLKVNDLATAGQFYTEIIGFDLMANIPQALFVSAGGYHHHLGLNTWMSAGSPLPPAESLGLNGFTINTPDVDEVVARLQGAGYEVEESEKGALTRDPSGNGVWLKTSV